MQSETNCHYRKVIYKIIAFVFFATMRMRLKATDRGGGVNFVLLSVLTVYSIVVKILVGTWCVIHVVILMLPENAEVRK